jgi:DNA-binding transcriptional LysR family regulator
MAICASPQYLIRAGTPKTPDDFLLHSCLHYTLVPINIEWGFDEQLLSPRFSTDSGHALKEAVIAGLGLAVMPRFLIEQELLDGSLAEVMSGSHMLLW